MVMVQDPSSAKYNGMPYSAINTELADFIAPVQDLPEKLLGYVNHFFNITSGQPAEKKVNGALNKIFALLRLKPEMISASTRRTPSTAVSKGE